MEFLQTHPLYVVAIIATVIWLGIFAFLMRLDRRVKKLEQMK
jgi:CcmD family protein